MKAKKRSILLLFQFVTIAGMISSCSKEGGKEDTSPPGPIAFKGESYRSIDNRTTVTLTSPDELEISEHGINLICKYSRQNDTLRVVMNSMGTSQALYYRITPVGLVNNTGQVLFSPENYAKEIERLRAERQRLTRLRADGTKQTQEFAKLHVSGETRNYEVTITDVGIGVKSETRQSEAYFADFVRLSPVKEVLKDLYALSIDVDYPEPRLGVLNRKTIAFTVGKNESDYAELRKTILKAYYAWKMKFPGLAKCTIE